jgi:hypothetical protein
MGSTRGTPRTLPRASARRQPGRGIVRGDGEGEEKVIDDVHGVDDWIAEIALARRALQRQLAGELTLLCRRRFTHPHRPTQFDALGYVVNDICACVRAVGHDHGCWCEHGIERVVYWVDLRGREHYVTRPLVPSVGGPF